MWGLGWQRQDISDQEYLLSFYVVCDESPSAAPKLLIKSVIRIKCGSGWDRREAGDGMRSEVSTEQREEATLEGKWGQFRGDNTYPLPGTLKTSRLGEWAGTGAKPSLLKYRSINGNINISTQWRVRPQWVHGSTAAFRDVCSEIIFS